MLSLWLLLSLLWMIYLILHSVLASSQVKEWFAYHLPQVKPYYRLIYNSIAFVGLLSLVYFYATWPANPVLSERPFMGWGFIGIAIVIGITALQQYDLGEFAGTRQVREAQQESQTALHTVGLNKVVRHPLYFAILIGIWGNFLRGGDDLSLATAIVMSLYVYVGAKWEEKKLKMAFGEAYVQYQKRTSMLIPWIF
ncbi:MAG: methyltransferase [Bacteroidota bacterium]